MLMKMQRMMHKAKKNKKGFTLIELIIVIAILAILALLVVPRLAGFTDTAKRQADENFGAMVVNTMKLAIASKDITGTGDITFTASGSSGTWSKADTLTINTNNYTDFADMMGKLVDNSRLQFYTTLDISVNATTSTIGTPRFDE